MCLTLEQARGLERENGGLIPKAINGYVLYSQCHGTLREELCYGLSDLQRTFYVRYL
jgi:hypothetical protein